MSYETFREMLIDLFDTTEGEVDYWRAKGLLSRPQTKSVEVVRILYEFMRSGPLRELPQVIKLDRGVWLTRNKSGDCYYHTDVKVLRCTCPEFGRGHTCQHLRAVTDQMTGPRLLEMPAGQVAEA
jgi:hypothetical protein